jgi:hypothetical protein
MLFDLQYTNMATERSYEVEDFNDNFNIGQNLWVQNKDRIYSKKEVKDSVLLKHVLAARNTCNLAYSPYQNKGKI